MSVLIFYELIFYATPPPPWGLDLYSVHMFLFLLHSLGEILITGQVWIVWSAERMNESLSISYFSSMKKGSLPKLLTSNTWHWTVRHKMWCYTLRRFFKVLSRFIIWLAPWPPMGVLSMGLEHCQRGQEDNICLLDQAPPVKRSHLDKPVLKD